MDLWVVAAATAVGYIAKYWQNLSSREIESSLETFSGDSILGHSEPRNLLQQIWDRKQGRAAFTGREDFTGIATTSDSSNNEKQSEKCGHYNVLSLTSFPPILSEMESFQEIGSGIEGSEALPDSTIGEMGGSVYGVTRSRQLRSRPYGLVKPLSSLESCLTDHLYREHARLEEYECSSLPLWRAPTVRPLLVTEGSRIISRGSRDFKGEMQLGRGEYKLQKGAGLKQVPKIGLLNLSRKPTQNIGNGQSKRLSSSSSRLSGGLFHSQGSPNGMLLFFLGIIIGILSTVVANKREVDNLDKLLKQTENLVQDLHEELEMKDLLTVNELSNVNSLHSSTPTAFYTERELNESAKCNGKKPDDQRAENSEAMSKIEAELEAELERLELKMKKSSLERISDFDEIDPNFEADIVQGDLRLDKVKKQPGDLSDSDRDMSGTSTNHTLNNAVSPRELSLRLHEVIQSRLEAHIMELETAIKMSQKKLHFMESKSVISQRDLYSEVESSSIQDSPAFIDEGNYID